MAYSLGEDQPFRYRGYVYDSDTQLYYLQSRYYDPKICRFISADVYGSGTYGLRDVTDEIDKALAREVEIARKKNELIDLTPYPAKFFSIYEKYCYFKALVDNYCPWDIKRKESWEATIGTEYPGFDVEVLYRGEVVTPEYLGNMTYGYLGAAYNIPLEILYYGSEYAAGFPSRGYDWINEMIDHCYIEGGYYLYGEDY